MLFLKEKVDYLGISAGDIACATEATVAEAPDMLASHSTRSLEEPYLTVSQKLQRDTSSE